LAEDYAISKGWCDFVRVAAEIPSLTKVDFGVAKAFSQPSFPAREQVRLAFFFTVYADATFVTRLFTHLYSPKHLLFVSFRPCGLFGRL
jgi:hypothetical protein